MAIDTLKVARRLREAGFSEPQAEAVVAAVQEGAEGADLATKGDLAMQSADLRAEMGALRSEMRAMEARLEAKIEAANNALLGRIVGLILGAVLVNVVTVVGALFAAVKLLGQ